MTEDNPLLLVDKVDQLNDLHSFMQDESLEEALGFVVQLMMKPDVPAAIAQKLIIKLQSYAAYFAMQATIYTTIKKDKAGTENANKKNIYYTAADSLDKVVQALKYAVKTQY